MNPLAFDNVSIARGARTVLRDVSFTVAKGAFIGVFGPNGAGKTTLLRAALGLVEPEAGRILVHGAAPRPGLPGIGYMPQARGIEIPLNLSGAAWVGAAWRGARAGLPFLSREGQGAVQDALALVSATSLAERPVHALSGGERQRLRLAQALLGAPDLLLLDEPLISLDPGHQTGVVSLVRRLCSEHGTTVLFSAHDLNPLLGHLDRVLYLGGGGAVLGTVDEVVTGQVLSALYGVPIEVVHANGRIFVMSGGAELDRAACGGHDA